MIKTRFIAILLLTWLVSCKDKTPTIKVENNPFKVYPTQHKQHVLLENFVSESNSQSVENSFFIKTLEKKYQDRLIVCNLHRQDWLETPHSMDLSSMLGGLSSYPRGAINRQVGINTILNEDNATLLNPLNWEYTIDNVLQQTPGIALAIETTLMPENIGHIKLHIAHKEALPQDMRIGLYMVENNISSIFQQGSNDNFTHQHVMKNALLGIEGDPINLSSENPTGEIISKEYPNIDLLQYHIDQLYLVAFVFNYDADFRKMKIYNAVQVKFGGVKFWNE